MRKLSKSATVAISSRITLVAALGAAVSACSSDFSRFGEGPGYTGSTSNQQAILSGNGGGRPQQPYPGDVTGSIEPQRSVVQQGALQPLPPVPAPQQTYASAPPPANEPSRVAAAPAPVPPAPQGAGGWSSANGTWVTLMPGENVDTLARRYSVPSKAILQANNLADASRMMPGQRVMIPTYSMQQAAPAPALAPMPAKVAPVAAAPKLVVGPQPVAQAPKVAPQPVVQPQKVAALQPAPVIQPPKAVPAPQAQSGVSIGPHVVRKGETVDGIAHSYGTTKAKLMAVNGLKTDTLQPGQKLTLPSGVVLKVAKNEPAAAPAPAPVVVAKAPVPVQPQPVAVQPAPAPAKQVASIQPAPVQVVAENASVAKEPAADAPATRVGKDPSFRWPVRGRVIGEFGSKAAGERNDGINLAVPEGTSIKSAEDGEVIYSGNELKGYGNLVLVRHADGWVSAYAHASKLLVNKGDKVSRGQIIANAGATGSVSQPQLHFELRKGQKPVDPTQYLTN